MIHLRMHVKLVLLGPILVQSNSQTVLGVDAVMSRNSKGKPYIPYTSVRGKLRQALEEIASISSLPGRSDQSSLTEVCQLVPLLFGPRSGDQEFLQERGILTLSDFVYQDVRPCINVRTRNKIDPKTGTAQTKMLQVIDSPWEIDEEAVFEGELCCICSSRTQADTIRRHVIAGLKWVRQFGAERTVGFGRVIKIESSDVVFTSLTNETPNSSISGVRDVPVSRPPTDLLNSKTGRYALRLRPRSPFCIGGVRKGGNLFSSEEIIPGGVIFGALATMWQSGSGLSSSDYQVRGDVGRWQSLGSNFHRITISHAFPTKRSSRTRPTLMPLALVAAEPWSSDIPTQLYDVSLCEAARMVGVTPDSQDKRPPVFCSDWKRHAINPATTIGLWPHVERELRVRTAIDAVSLRSAETQLFAYESIVPEDLDWFCYVDLSKIPNIKERNAVLEDLAAICSGGFGPFGKTKAWADIEFVDASDVQAACVSSLDPIDDNYWIATLQTPALLCKSNALTDQTGKGLYEAYKESWRKLTGDTLELVRFFASQSFAAPRFSRRLPRDSSGNYSPFVLTDSGSTFVLKAKGDLQVAKSSLSKLLQFGLPLLPDFLDHFGNPGEADWQRCPYLNRHGYGEIAINLPWFYRPQEGHPVVLKGE